MENTKNSFTVKLKELTGVETLMLHYVNQDYDRDTIINYNFWYYTYNINAARMFDYLLSKGYIEKVKNVKLALSKLKVEDLKNILRENELKVTGRKKELIERIVKNEVPLSESIENQLSFKVNNLYKEYLRKTTFIKYMNSNNFNSINISLDDALKYKLANPDKDDFNLILDILNNHLNTSNNKNYKKSLIISKIDLLLKFEQYSKALESLLLLTYIDINDMDSSVGRISPYENSFYKMTPYTKRNIQKCVDKLDYSDNNLKTFIDSMSIIFRNYIYEPLFKNNEFISIILAELNNDQNYLNYIYAQTEKRFLLEKNMIINKFDYYEKKNENLNIPHNISISTEERYNNKKRYKTNPIGCGSTIVIILLIAFIISI